MAIENNKSLVQFGYAINKDASTTAGFITFDSGKQAIYVGDGSTANLVTSSVKDATFAESVLTITKTNGDVYTLDFSDVASASGVSMNFKALDERVTSAKNVADDASTAAAANATAIGNLSDKLDASFGALETAYKAADASIRTDFTAADASLSERIDALDEAIGENGSVATQISNAINALEAAPEDVDDSSFVKVKVEQVAGELKAVTVTTHDIAKNTDLNAHINDASKHITDDERTKWNQAAADVSAFLHDASLGDEVINTLTEIQNYITSDASLADQITQNIADVSTAAAAAQADVDAVEEALGAGFSKESTVAAQLAAVKDTADAAAVKSSVDASLALKADKTALADTDASITAIKNSYVISFGGAKGEISVDTTNNAQGEVKFTMDGSTLKGAVNGLGTAAFVDTTAFDAAGAAATAKSEAISAVTGSADDESTSKTIEGTRKYAEELVAAVPAATVTGVNTANASDGKGYVTIALELNSSKEVAVKSVAVDTQAVADATETNDGLATAYDVKQYVDGKDAAMDGRMDAVEAQLKWVVL